MIKDMVKEMKKNLAVNYMLENGKKIRGMAKVRYY